jgi:hypothetical protein
MRCDAMRCDILTKRESRGDVRVWSRKKLRRIGLDFFSSLLLLSCRIFHLGLCGRFLHRRTVSRDAGTTEDAGVVETKVLTCIFARVLAGENAVT